MMLNKLILVRIFSRALALTIIAILSGSLWSIRHSRFYRATLPYHVYLVMNILFGFTVVGTLARGSIGDKSIFKSVFERLPSKLYLLTFKLYLPKDLFRIFSSFFTGLALIGWIGLWLLILRVGLHPELSVRLGIASMCLITLMTFWMLEWGLKAELNTDQRK